MGRRAVRLPMDVRRLDQVRAAVEATVAQLGRLDLLVNNAGLGPSAPAEAVTEEDFDLTLDVNVKGAVLRQPGGRPGDDRAGVGADHQPQLAGRVRRAADRVGLLHDQGGGRAPHASAWRSSGGAMGSRSTPSRRRSSGRRAPSADLADPAFRADVDERIAGLHRIGEPMDVAGAVVYLASPAAALVTGTTLLVDGGWTAR